MPMMPKKMINKTILPFSLPNLSCIGIIRHKNKITKARKHKNSRIYCVNVIEEPLLISETRKRTKADA
ncbi:hypothetical protein RFY10_13405, partial [Acinetobacter baumannii]|nr:hypothetical protein [Acinetobacter baumannii]